MAHIMKVRWGRWWMGLAIAAALGVAPRAEATQFKLEALSERELMRLPAEAREVYAKGLQYYDHILYERALEAFVAAVELAPNSYELRLIVHRLASYRGKVDYKVENQSRFYDTAITQLEAILAMESLNPRRRQFIESELNRTLDQRRNLVERDEKRKAHGRQIAIQYAGQIYTTQNEAAETRALNEARKLMSESSAAQQEESAAEAAKALAALSAESAQAESEENRELRNKAKKVVELTFSGREDLLKQFMAEDMRDQMDEAEDSAKLRADQAIAALGLGEFEEVQTARVTAKGEEPVVIVSSKCARGQLESEIRFDKEGDVIAIEHRKKEAADSPAEPL